MDHIQIQHNHVQHITMECNHSPSDLSTLIAVEHNLLIIMALVALLVISCQKVPKITLQDMVIMAMHHQYLVCN